MAKLIAILLGYLLLAYLLFQAATELYEPTRAFHLSGLLWFTHLMILYIHEAGHFFFRIFGNTIYILGGSLMQVLAPMAWFGVALYENSKLTNVALLFTGISLIDVSIYIKDAGMLLLPLIGGLSKYHHDWLNLFQIWGGIENSYVVGEIVFWFGLLLGMYGIGNGVWIAVRDFREE
jgi:hypothetical protein